MPRSLLLLLRWASRWRPRNILLLWRWVSSWRPRKILLLLVLVDSCIQGVVIVVIAGDVVWVRVDSAIAISFHVRDFVDVDWLLRASSCL